MLQKLLVRNATRGVVLAESAGIADSSQARRTGLLKHSRLERGDGLWIVPCEAVHTFGMKFPIDVLFLSKKRKVLKIRKNMVARRMAICWRATSVLELPAGTADASGTVPGDDLELTRL